jgi:hypothetical protein
MTNPPNPPTDWSFTPGVRVRHPGQPDWGIGQVQSAIGRTVTVNFEHRGKVVVHADVVPLEPVEDEDDRR